MGRKHARKNRRIIAPIFASLLLTFFAISFIFLPFVYPESTGFKSPTKTGSPSDDWAKGSYITASDNKYTTTSTLGDLLDTQDYDFNIPPGANITGILVQVEMKSNGTVEGEAAYLSVDLSWSSGVGASYTESKQQKVVYGDAEQYYNFGSSSDLWGRVWNDNEFSNAKFRARINFSDQDGAGNFDPGVNHIQIEVYYTQHHTITINSPENASTTTYNYALLNWTVEDPDVDTLEIWAYGANDTSDLNEALLYHVFTVMDPITLTYNFTAPVTQPDANTIMLFHMDNRTEFSENNTHLYDFSRSGNNGTGQYSISPTSSGYIAGGFEFDGTNDLIVIDNSSTLDVDNLTIAMWIKPESTASAPVLVIRDLLLTSGYVFQLSYISYFYRLQFDDGTGGLVSSDNNAFAPNEWTHVAVTVNSTTVTFYSNGEEWGTDVGTHSISNNDNNLVIGKSPNIAGSNGYNGTMDEIALWNRTLSAEEIKDLYRLREDIYYWNVSVSDGTNSSSNGTFQFEVLNPPPNITINEPENQSTTTDNYALLNWTLNDDDTMEVWVYGTNNTGDMFESLLYHNTTAVDGTFTYNFTSLVTQPDASTIILMHMDNRSEFGENSTYVYDFSGEGNNGTAKNDASPTSSGYLAGGFEFDGSGDYIEIFDSGTVLDFDNTSNYTWAAWLKFQDFPKSQQCYISKDPPAKATGFNLCFNETGSTGDVVVCNSAFACSPGLNLDLSKNVWVHVVITYYGSDEWYVYQDGIYKGVLNISAAPDTDSNYYIGSGTRTWIPQYPDYYFNGTIDEVAVWNRSLSADEIKNLYQLKIDTYYWNVTVFDGENTTSNATLEFSVVNAPPSITVNSPENKTNIPDYYALLNWSINDINEDTMEVWVYGANDTGDMFEALLYHETGLTDGTYTYNFTSPVTQPDTSTVLLMHLDNRSEFGENNTNIYDFTGTKNNGTGNGNAVPTTDGKFAGAFYFDGNGDYIQIQDSATSLDFDDAGNYTWSFWINPQPISGKSYLLAKYVGGLSANGYIIALLNSMNISMARYNPLGGGFTNEVVTTKTLSTGVWYHVAIVFNTESNISIYIDGDLDATGSGAYTDDTTSVVRISNAGTEALNGTMDEVVIWNRTLSADEIEDLYQLKVNNKYYWNVTAFDGTNTSSNATWEFNISTVVSISLPVSSIAFNELNVTQTNATDDNDPPPLILQNDGNVRVDATISASHIWNGTGAQNPSSYYQFQSAENETGTVIDDSSDLILVWTNIPTDAGMQVFVTNMGWQDTADSIKGHINLTVPSDEPAGGKSSVVTFIASQS